MEELNSHDWLQPVWTIELRVRKSEKTEKYYFSPESGLKFNSKVEAIVEKAMAEGLPPGWEKETRITTKGDTCYIDPVSGYTFCSITDVDRYLVFGKIGSIAFKPKDKDSSDMELKADKSPSASVTMKPTLSVSMSQSSDLDLIANEQQIPRPASSGEYMHVPISECISNQCVVGTELASSVLSRAESSNQKEGKVGFAQSALVSSCTYDDAKEKQLQEHSETEHGTKKASSQDRQCRKRQKKEINLPRRASKRLAGIKADPVPELKTRNRRVVVKQSGEEETITNADKSPTSMPDGVAKQFNAPEVVSEVKCKSEKHIEKTLVVQRSGKDKECFTYSHHENNANVEESVRVLENGAEVNANFDYTSDIPLRELLKDPCIAFAFHTLTGETYETSKNLQTSSELKNRQHSETSAATAGCGEGHGKKSNDRLGDNVFSSPENLTIPQEHPGGDTKTEDKAKNENAGPSSEKTHDM